MDTSPYAQAIDAARAELRDIAEQLTILRRRKERLEATVATLTPLLAPDTATSEIPLELTGGYKTPPLWLIIRDLMCDRDAFTVTEAGVAYDKVARNPLGPNRPQIIRNSLVRHPETFEQMPTGVWRVREDARPANEKEASEETP